MTREKPDDDARKHRQCRASSGDDGQSPRPRILTGAAGEGDRQVGLARLGRLSSRPRKQPRAGAMEGARLGAALGVAPSTTLRVVPLPRRFATEEDLAPGLRLVAP